MADLLKQYEDKVETITLIPSGGGAFEVKVDDKLIYSKLQTGRHPEEGEVSRLVRKAI
jgi:selenoprotein W-related protein